MAFVWLRNHHNLIYILLAVLYSMVSLNFYITYQLNKQCNARLECNRCQTTNTNNTTNSRPTNEANTDPNSKTVPQIQLSPDLKNESQIQIDAQNVNQELSDNHIHRDKRHLIEREYRYVENVENRNESNPVANDHNSDRVSGQRDDQRPHTERGHHLRHQRKMKYRSAPNQAYEENNGPVVDFFPKPQPTHETPGYAWLTSYSRIPVSN